MLVSHTNPVGIELSVCKQNKFAPDHVSENAV